MALQHLRSSTANKRPVPGNMSDGQLGINTNLASPGLFFKDTNGDLVKVGPVHVGTTAPNASPAAGGTAGNSVGEQWLDTTGGTYVFKVWDGSAWRSESGTFVDVNGDVMTGALGIIAGSAGSPGLYFSGDTNTGLYSPGADQLALSTNGTGRLFINASGQIFLNQTSQLSSHSAPSFELTGDTVINSASFGTGNESSLYFYHRRLNDTATRPGSSIHSITEDSYTSGNAGTFDSALVLRTVLNNVATERARIDSSGTFRVKGAGTAGVNDAVQLNGSAPANSLLLDASGRLLVGTTSSSGDGSLLQVRSDTGVAAELFRSSANDGPAFLTFNKSRGTAAAPTVVNADDRVGGLIFRGYSGTAAAYVEAARIQAFVDGEPDTAGDTTDMPGRLVFSTTADGASSPTEAMSITSEGYIFTDSTARTNRASVKVLTGGLKVISASTDATTRMECFANSTATRYGIAFSNPNGVVGSISTNASATAYNTSSDYRLKENVTPVTDGITRLQQLKPSRFNFIADPAKTVDGFIAHEVQAIVPEAITGEKDAVDDDGNPIYQGIDQSKLVPLLTAALQEAVAKIESLEARLTAAGI